MSTSLSKAASRQYQDMRLASSVARNVSKLLAKGGWQRSIATSARNRSEGFVVSRMGYSSEIQIYWSHSTHLPPVARDTPEWAKARENENQMWQFLRDRGYEVNEYGHINVSKHYYTPPPAKRTPAVMRQLDKLDNALLANVAKMEAQADKLKLKELLAAAKEAEDAFRAFAQAMQDDPTTGNDASAETALQIAERLRKAAEVFEEFPPAQDSVANANDEWTQSENETEFPPES